MRGARIDRRTLLDDVAASEGNAWADWWRCELQRQGRPRVGGWPGTISEGRMRVVRRISAELGRAFAVTAAEIDRTVRSAYDTARRSWDLGSSRDEDPTARTGQES